MSSTWYEADRWAGIHPVEIEHETAFCVYLANGRRREKNSAAVWLRPTWEEAKECLVTYYTSAVIRAEQQLEASRKRLAEAESL